MLPGMEKLTGGFHPEPLNQKEFRQQQTAWIPPRWGDNKAVATLNYANASNATFGMRQITKMWQVKQSGVPGMFK